MRTLDDLLSPITPDRFFADLYGRKPRHIPADEGTAKRDLLGWDAFNGLLNQSSIWTQHALKLVRDTTPIPPCDFCRSVSSQAGQSFRPDPAKVAHAMQLARAQDDFVLEDPFAQFDFVSKANIRAALAQAFQAGALRCV